MREYTAEECRCWSKYPNKNHKRGDQWKCVDCYELVQDGDGWSKKTRCVLKEVSKMTDRERYIHIRKEARRYHRKYLRYAKAWEAVIEKIRSDESLAGNPASARIIDLINDELGLVAEREVKNGKNTKGKQSKNTNNGLAGDEIVEPQGASNAHPASDRMVQRFGMMDFDACWNGGDAGGDVMCEFCPYQNDCSYGSERMDD